MTDEPNTNTPTIESLTEQLRHAKAVTQSVLGVDALLRAALLTVGGREIVLPDAELRDSFGKQMHIGRGADCFEIRFDDEPSTTEPPDHE